MQITESEYKIAAEVFESKEFNSDEVSEIAALIKANASLLLARIEQIPATNNASARCRQIAQTRLEEAVMWAVKSCSRV